MGSEVDSPTAVSVFVFDEDDDVRRMLVETIDADPGLDVVGSADSEPCAVNAICRLTPTVAVLDADRRQADGLDICRELGLRAPGVRCVVLAAGLARRWRGPEAREAGAAAYLEKQLVDFPLRKVIREVAAMAWPPGQDDQGNGAGRPSGARPSMSRR